MEEASIGGGEGSGSFPAMSLQKLKGAVTIPEHKLKRFHKLLSDAVVSHGFGCCWDSKNELDRQSVCAWAGCCPHCVRFRCQVTRPRP